MKKISFLIAYFFNFMPHFILNKFASLLAFLWVDVFGIRKDVVYANIEIAFPGTSVKLKKKWMKYSLYVLMKSLFDLFRIPFLTDRWIDNNAKFHGFEKIQSVEGCFFLCLHMASGDLAAAMISRRYKPLSLISKRFKNKYADQFWFSIRERSETQFIDAHGKNNAFEILKALKSKRAVIFVMDQFMGKPYGIETIFFGKKTGTAYGLALFAQKTKKPVFPLYSYFDDLGKLNICIKPAIDLSALITDDKETSYVNITNQFNLEIEKIITEHPEQWMWVHKRWKVFE